MVELTAWEVGGCSLKRREEFGEGWVGIVVVMETKWEVKPSSRMAWVY